MRLAGQEGTSAPVWVQLPDGTPIYVLWPAGFYARFTAAGLELFAGAGQLVARGGQVIDLGAAGDSGGASSFEVCEINGIRYPT